MRVLKIWLGVFAFPGSSRELWDEEKLQLELFEGYNRDVRPINMGAILKPHDAVEKSKIRKRKASSESYSSLDEFIQEQCDTFIG